MSPTRAAARELDARLDALAWAVLDLRDRFPEDDYAGRVYRCEPCCSLDFAAAPADDLVDDYPCPQCGEPQTPVVSPGVPRRSAARRRPRNRRVRR